MRETLCRMVTAAVLVLVFAGCGRYRDIRLTSIEVQSVSPRGLRSADAILEVGVDNPARRLSISDIKATVHYCGKALADLTSDGVVLDGRSVKTYDIPVKASLCSGVDAVSLLSIIGGIVPDSLKLDISARAVTAGGVGRNLEYKSLPLDSILEDL